MRRRARALVLAGAACTGWQVGAEQTTATVGNATAPVSTTARLDFLIDIGKFLFFRVGTAAYPTASGTVDTANLGTLRIPPGAVVPAPGNNTTVVWDGTLPSYGSAAVPVEVRSNAGQITLRATVVTPLASGANTIPYTQITVSSSDAGLPAPPLPNAGAGTTVNVTGTSFANLVTERAAVWTFSYAPATSPPAGTYTGQISFTASSL